MLYVFAVRFESGRSSCSRRQTKANILTRTAQQDVAGCGGMWLDVAWLWLDVRLSWLRSRAKKLFANMQNVNSFPSRLLWSFWPCGMNWIFISHVPCGSYVGFYRAEAEVEQRRFEQEQQTHKCQLNKMFRFRAGNKKRCRRWHISVSADSFAISLSHSLSSHLAHPPFAT